ncbi:hypothetical protein LI90_3068 [Carbonactinospora thermoautotrophica]|uniref:Uncharacterized protein n=1 Tax=Carbonactinospora thermoautotrophica TaxID=1469144 RepID=A0A132MXD8_9ACTN|nr:hypothetical protein LI90_3068 [Carbonactinospora thermoautotrophica]
MPGRTRRPGSYDHGNTPRGDPRADWQHRRDDPGRCAHRLRRGPDHAGDRLGRPRRAAAGPGGSAVLQVAGRAGPAACGSPGSAVLPRRSRGTIAWIVVTRGSRAGFGVGFGAFQR